MLGNPVPVRDQVFSQRKVRAIFRGVELGLVRL